MIEKYEDIPKADLQPMIDEIIGMVLARFRGFTHDCNGDAINEDAFYKTEKYVPSGQIIVMPTEKNAKKEFFNDVMNKGMKSTGKLN